MDKVYFFLILLGRQFSPVHAAATSVDVRRPIKTSQAERRQRVPNHTRSQYSNPDLGGDGDLNLNTGLDVDDDLLNDLGRSVETIEVNTVSNSFLSSSGYAMQ